MTASPGRGARNGGVGEEMAGGRRRWWHWHPPHPSSCPGDELLLTQKAPRKKACVLERDGEGKGRFLCTRGQCTVDYKILEVFKHTQRSKLARAHTRILCGCIHVAHLDMDTISGHSEV